MIIVKHPHWNFYGYTLEPKTGKITYIHPDGSWQDQAAYFSSESEIEALVKTKKPVVTPVEPPTKIGVSKFAEDRHYPGKGYSYFRGYWHDLIEMVKQHWGDAVPGNGETDCTRKIVTPVPPDLFVSSTVKITENTMLEAKPKRRQENEDLFVSIKCAQVSIFHGQIEPVVKAEVVLYSREALLENNGEVSGDYDWEIVAILAKSTENEPMHPLTMARNFLEKAGGTKSTYTAEQFAEAIYYWSQRVSI